MSLEQAIQENTAAVKALTEMLAVLRAPAVGIDAASKAGVTVTYSAAADTPPEPKPDKKAPAPKAEKPATPPPAPAPEPKAEEPAVTLADLQEHGKKLLDAGKQGDLKALVTKLGGTKLSTLDAAKYPEALAELKKLTANL